MSDAAIEYGLFVAELFTVLIGIAVAVGLAAALARRGRPPGELEVRRLNDRLEAMARALRRATRDRRTFRREERSRRRARRSEGRAPGRPRTFVLDFKGDLRARGVTRLREEVTAVLTLATSDDRVIVRLENSGGLVHEHGLAASQLLRIRARGIPLLAAVDKVAASGGYMMACVADRIVAAPFAVLGSIGVLLQVPNFHRFLEARGIDLEMIKGGRYKRTLSLFGENTDEDRAKAREEVEDIHRLFLSFVAENRPSLDVERVGTGEHWYGTRALELGLCDELRTSDDLLLEASERGDVYEVRYAARTGLGERLATVVEAAGDRLESRWRERRRYGRLAL